MKIVKEGLAEKKIDKNETLKITCKNCGAELEVGHKDIIASPFLIKFHCICPWCDKWINIPSQSIGKNLKEIIRGNANQM